MKLDRGLALPDLLNGAYEYIETINFKPHARIYLLDFLATTEYVHLDIFLFSLYADGGDILGTGYQLEATRRSSSLRF